jgi:hypothetical protein
MVDHSQYEITLRIFSIAENKKLNFQSKKNVDR